MEGSLSELYGNVKYDMDMDMEITSDNSGDNSPFSTTFSACASISSPKRRRAIQKKVVTFPLKEVQGSRFKGECTPPSDSWAWRKYGQKPIKGSPYPRGYYRCSSSKGCPARKQVEKSRADPNTLVVTYSYDHNHPWPISRNHHQNRHNNVVAAAATSSAPTTAENNNNSTRVVSSTCTTNNKSMQTKIENNHVAFQQNNDEHDQLLPPTDELAWFTSDHQILENNLLFSNLNDLDMEKIFPMREEDDSLFADLEELPECSVVFRRAAGVVAVEECNLPPPTWCGATG
ncbi:hypothetical protein SOVF_030320 isoform A [Spinacia oleracea]|uniref:Probable WRKY transcription factor 65 isoform X2 n=1 Tax=Spinacia oleracea TaxID=3562 RepID=A0A9R0JPL7_SPIOL|nr:probable WRKY transcription factor 65 isoform X2 [Spinacia oleracea]KNA22822.1 hypothetical protein SOVF_030320 isoform A [Spinacia oleracea]